MSCDVPDKERQEVAARRDAAAGWIDIHQRLRRSFALVAQEAPSGIGCEVGVGEAMRGLSCGKGDELRDGKLTASRHLGRYGMQYEKEEREEEQEQEQEGRRPDDQSDAP